MPGKPYFEVSLLLGEHLFHLYQDLSELSSFHHDAVRGSHLIINAQGLDIAGGVVVAGLPGMVVLKNDRSKTCFKTVVTSNDIIAGNDRVLKFYLFIVWLYLFKK